jgi:SSS family transporter
VIAASFLFFLAVFIGVGVSAYRFARSDSRDYLLASQTTPAWLAGLSAVATNNSGYMFIGVIGYTYATGLPALWMMVGWLAGDAIASHFVHARLRGATTAETRTFAGLLAEWDGEDRRVLRVVGGLLSIAFLGAYAAAQLNAGSKALSVLFGWENWVGATIGAVIVLAYCVAGGIRASIWTDAAQSFVMIVAMAVLLAVAVSALGGPAAAWARLDAVDPHYLDVMPSGLAFGEIAGPALFIIGWVFAGASVVGQPHVMVRFMALDDAGNMNRARGWYYGFFVTFYLMASGVGLLSRAFLAPEGFDAELALPTLALELLPELLVGLILAGVFAATMSTADSLVLACSASISEDLVERGRTLAPGPRLWLVKGATVAVTALALAIALTGPESVFVLVIYAWSALAAAFGPLLVVQALGQRVREGLALAMMGAGVLAVVAWKAVPVLADFYEGMAGITVGFLVFAVGRRLGAAWRREAVLDAPVATA